MPLHKLAIPLLILAYVVPAGAATFVVNATGDAGDLSPGDGVCDSVLAGVDCTLRAAVQEANALAGADTIQIPTLAISLDIAGADDAAALGDLDVTTDSLEIIGSSQTGTRIDQIVSGEAVFEVLPGAALTLSTLTLVGADDGIVNQGRLDMSEMTIDVSGTFGVDSTGPVTAKRVTWDGAGSTHLRTTTSALIQQNDFRGSTSSGGLAGKH